MMSEDQVKSLKEVYRNFLNHDYNRSWTDMDYLLYDLDYLNDEQTVIEAETQLFRHGMGILKCKEDHGESTCLVPLLMECVGAICDLWQETNELHPKNRYVLHNYLAVSHKGIIYVEEEPK